MREAETERMLFNALQLPPLQTPLPLTLPLPQFLADSQQLRERPLPLEPPSQNPNSNPQRDNSFPSAFQRHSSPPTVGGAGGGGTSSTNGVSAPSGLKNGVGVGSVPSLNLGQGPSSPSSWLLDQVSKKENQTLPGIEERIYPPLLPSFDDVRSGALDKIKETPNKDDGEKKRRVRVKWTEDETNDLYHGVKQYGVGNWMKILKDPKFKFNNRSSVDLKDRFRTLFPQQYNDSKSTNNTVVKPAALSNFLDNPQPETSASTPSKTGRTRHRPHSHVQVLSKLGLPLESSFPKAKRKSRLPFTAEEDERLMKGYLKHGATWTKIHSDPDLDLGHRRSTDLRDRFRTRYPQKYAEAGFKARPKVKPRPRRSGPAHPNEGEGSDSSIGGGNSGSMNGNVVAQMGGQNYNTISGLTLPHPNSQQPPSSLHPPLQVHNDPLPSSLDEIMNSTTTLNDSPPATTKDEHLNFLIHHTPLIFDLPTLPPPTLPSCTSSQNSILTTSAGGPPTNSDTSIPPLFGDGFTAGLLDFSAFTSSSTSSTSNDVGDPEAEEETERALQKGLGWEDLAARPIFDLGVGVGVGPDDHSGMKGDDLMRKRRCVR